MTKQTLADRILNEIDDQVVTSVERIANKLGESNEEVKQVIETLCNENIIDAEKYPYLGKQYTYIKIKRL